ncbi:vomeronasal type-1 receptor 4-like [Dromiciops gliroides]|uniref:vomeronasal type-1 receptor 4-like n=1 Tax=Dromiciops gliroides TaxID=33562 RepID=UPI001CC540A5|nr:vomeronasal type-1 receptor 4-like [Dromiciops gliroides]
MQSHEDILCIFYTLQIITGIISSLLLFYLYGFNLLTSQKIRSIDVIYINLSFSHILLILFKGVIFAVQICIQTFVLGDTECKIIIYLQRVSRSLCLCTTCHLSIYQAVTISSGRPLWAELRAKAQKYIVPSCAFIWVLSLLIDVDVPWYVNGPRNSTNSKLLENVGHCSLDRHAMAASKLVIRKLLYDAVFLGIMAITSGYMVIILYRHHCQVQHIHTTSLNPNSSIETRATKVILLLTSLFICFYSLSSMFIVVMENAKDKNQWVIHMIVFFNLCFPIFSPFVIISSDSQIHVCSNPFKKIKKKSYPHPLILASLIKHVLKHRVIEF